MLQDKGFLKSSSVAQEVRLTIDKRELMKLMFLYDKGLIQSPDQGLIAIIYRELKKLTIEKPPKPRKEKPATGLNNQISKEAIQKANTHF